MKYIVLIVLLDTSVDDAFGDNFNTINLIIKWTRFLNGGYLDKETCF